MGGETKQTTKIFSCKHVNLKYQFLHLYTYDDTIVSVWEQMVLVTFFMHSWFPINCLRLSFIVQFHRHNLCSIHHS